MCVGEAMDNVILVDIRKIAPGTAVDAPGEVLIEIAPSYGVDEAVACGFRGALRNVGGLFVLEGEGEAELKMACASCLTPVRERLRFPVSQVFYDPDVVQSEDDEAIKFTGKEIDLTPAIAEGLYLAIPMRITCAEDCKGLCVSCGANLNEADCDCASGEVNEEFSRMLQGVNFADSEK